MQSFLPHYRNIHRGTVEDKIPVAHKATGGPKTRKQDMAIRIKAVAAGLQKLGRVCFRRAIMTGPAIVLGVAHKTAVLVGILRSTVSFSP